MAGAVPDITLLHVIQYPVSSIYMEPITLILILTDGLIFIVRLDIFILPSQGRHYHYQFCPPGYVRPESKVAPLTRH